MNTTLYRECQLCQKLKLKNKKERVEKAGKLANDVVKKGKWNETYRQ